MNDPFKNIKLPAFGNAPDVSQELTRHGASKEPAQDKHTLKKSSSELERLYYVDTSGDFDVFKYGRLSNVPIYKLISNNVLGREEVLELEKDTERKISFVAVDSPTIYPLHSKVVKKLISQFVFEDESGNVILDAFEDSIMLQVYDPDLLKSSLTRPARQRLENDPQDINAWIEFSRSRDEHLTERSHLERRLLIIQKAFEVNEGNVELLKEYVAVYDQLHSPEDTLSLYRGLVSKHPDLRPYYFAHRLHSHRTFNVFSVQEEFEGTADSFEYVRFLFDSGYTERALRIIEHLTILHYKQSVEPTFEYPKQPVQLLVVPPTATSDGEALVEWLRTESYRCYKFACSRRPLDRYEDEMMEDPDRLVCRDDVIMFTFKPRLDDIFRLFGFSAALPRPTVLFDSRCSLYERKKEAIMSMPVDVIMLLQAICLDITLDSGDVSAAFHFLLLGGPYTDLDLTKEDMIMAIVLYLTCERHFDLAFEWVMKLNQTRDFCDGLFSELRVYGKLNGCGVELYNNIELQTYSYMKGESSMLPQSHVLDVLQISAILAKKSHQERASEWFDVNFQSSITLFDLFIQEYHSKMSKQAMIRKLSSDLNDDQLYVLVRWCREICGHFVSKLSTPFQAIQAVLLCNTATDCVNVALKAINKYPYHKQVYMTSIDRLCTFEQYDMAMSVLSVMEERGIRCRTLIEEMQF